MCARPENFLYSNSVLGSSDEENHPVGSLSRQFDEGHAGMAPDSSPTGDPGMVVPHTHTKTRIFTQTESLSTDTDRTILASHTEPVRTVTTTKMGSQIPLEQAGHSSRMLPMLSAVPNVGSQRVQQWVTAQTTVPCYTPPVSVIQTLSLIHI